MRDRALILGGGGGTGNAWLIGVIAGLFDAGSDVTKADLLVGTSAGSTTAAQLGSGTPPKDLFANILAEGAKRVTSPIDAGDVRRPIRLVPDLMETTAAVIAGSDDAADMRRKMGTALQKNSTPGSSAQWRTTVASRLPSHHWPQQSMLIPAVNAYTGEPIVFDRHSGVDLIDAVAASCAGGFAYSFGDNGYIDGGYRADLNADLAAGYGRILIIAPFGGRTRKPLPWGLHEAAQVDDLRKCGSTVKTIFPDSDAQNALGDGMALLDLTRRRPSAEAGYNQGKTTAEQILEFWR